MSGLIWKMQRLRAMGAGEVLYRLRQLTQAGLERRDQGRAQVQVLSGAPGRAWMAALPHGIDAAIYRGAADRVLAGRFDVFAIKDAALGFPPEWNRDPKTGVCAPLEFGKTLNYRDERIVGDIKYLWEPNRHAELVTLAQAWHLTHEERYVYGCLMLLESWFEQCPYPVGVHWTSSLEHGVRLVNWAVAWFLLGVGGCLDGGLGPCLRRNDEGNVRNDGVSCRVADTDSLRRWLGSVHQHCHFIAGHFSRYSSANNHLLGELMGLFIGATVWPFWPESARWREMAAREFEAEALKQNGEDGVNREQALWYQHEVADMMLLVGLIGRSNGIEFSPAYWGRLERMLEFIASVMDVGGNVPMIGDADDARLVRFDPRPQSCPYRSLLATGAVLFGRGDFKAKAVVFDDKSRWLLGDAAALSFDGIDPMPLAEPKRDFPLGGYAVLGERFSTPEEIRVVADAGPLGYLSIAAHGHADALAFTLSAGGREILIDPGTYAYHTQRKWRDYFKGTSAHNTVRVDGLDQSVSGGSFLWSRHAKARRERFVCHDERESWAGSHDGYLRLRDPVLHRRTLDLDKTAGVLRVTDRLECRGRHQVELFWHGHEDCEAGIDGDVVRLQRETVRVGLRMTAPEWLPRIVRGQEAPPLGWVSRRFDEKAPCPVAVWVGEIEGATELVTEIEIG